MKIDISKFNEEQFLLQRQNSIGGSDVSAILGLNKYATPVQIFLSKTESVQSIDNKYTKAGKKQEQIIAEYFAEENPDLTVSEEKSIYYSDEYDYLSGSPDRLYTDKYGNKGILECKFISEYFGDVEDFEMYVTHYYQVLHYLYVTDIKQAVIAYLIKGYEYKQFDIKFDQETERFYRETVLPKLVGFWECNVLRNQAPQAIVYEDLSLKYKSVSESAKVTADTEILKYYQELRELKAMMKELDEKESILKAKIGDYIGEAEYLTDLNENVLVSFKMSNVESFNSKAFKKEYPELAQSYITTKQQRRFLIKETK